MKQRPPTLAIVHDDGDVARALTHTLRERGVRVLTAVTLRDASTLFRLSRPNLLLAGIAECEAAPDQLARLRSAAPGKAPVPVVALVRPGVPDEHRALRLGIQQQLIVPCDEETLCRTVGGFLPLSSRAEPAPASMAAVSPETSAAATKHQQLEELFTDEESAAERSLSVPEAGLQAETSFEALEAALVGFDGLAEATSSFLEAGELAEVLEEVRSELFERLPLTSLLEVEPEGRLSVPPGADRVLGSMAPASLTTALDSWRQSAVLEIERRHPGRLETRTAVTLLPALGGEPPPAQGPTR